LLAKNKKLIKYPSILDIGPYLSSNPQNNHKTANNENISHTSVKYQLYGVLIHEGFNMNSGHYYSFIKAPNNCWYKADDDYVSLSSGDLPLKQEAYVLFYIREDIPPPSTTPKETPPSNDGTLKSTNSQTNGTNSSSSLLNSTDKKRKLSFEESPNKHLKTSNGVVIRTCSISAISDLQSIPTWDLENETDNVEITLQKKEQRQLAILHSQKIKAMQIQPKDEHDKQLDKGRTKKVKNKRAFSLNSNQFQLVSNRRSAHQ